MITHTLLSLHKNKISPPSYHLCRWISTVETKTNALDNPNGTCDEAAIHSIRIKLYIYKAKERQKWRETKRHKWEIEKERRSLRALKHFRSSAKTNDVLVSYLLGHVAHDNDAKRRRVNVQREEMARQEKVGIVVATIIVVVWWMQEKRITGIPRLI